MGKLLLDLRRPAEAERYFTSLYHNNRYLTPAEYYLGQVFEALGDIEEAKLHYGRFVDLWKDADPELQPRVEAARRAIAALSPDA